MQSTEWNAIYSDCNDLREITAKTIDLLATEKKQKLATKPWLTRGKTKHTMYKTHFFLITQLK